jgi:hypothetical protein
MAGGTVRLRRGSFTFEIVRRLNSQPGQFPCPKKDPGEHGAIQTACIRVAQRWVIGGQKMHSVGENVLRTMGEPIGRLPGNDAHLKKISEIAVKGDLAKAHHHPNARKSMNLIGQMRSAVTNLLRERFIPRRRTADDRGYPCMAQLKPVVAGYARWLAGKA